MKILGWLFLLLVGLLAPARAADITGKWQVTISISGETITGKASLKQAGATVTGWVGPDENDPIPVSGEREGNRVTIRTSPQPGRSVAFERCELIVKGDRMAGTIDGDKGKIEFARSKQ